tara:strand:+ start:6939 stop:7073 length:135 start_codon:yes stop_codon:yes gene_type:complete
VNLYFFHAKAQSRKENQSEVERKIFAALRLCVIFNFYLKRIIVA